MIVVSTGFHRTHLTVAAHEAHVRGDLRQAIAGAYPTPLVKRSVRAMRLERGRIARMLERDERIPPEHLQSLFAPELLDEAGRLLKRLPVGGAYPALSAACMRLYGSLAARELARVARPGDIYHFRAGFGHASIRQAQQLGMVTLCDHAAVHPNLTESVVAPGSALQPSRADVPKDPITRAILSDIDAADAIVVNSDFIRHMFVRLGYPPERLHVVYLGVDEAFLAEAAAHDRERCVEPLRLMFAGRFDRAKGADLLITALEELDSPDWQLGIAGPIGADIRRESSKFLADPRVVALGTINRRELAREMSAAPVFVFPSLSEGSARVVFEALACGCYVITTPNSGSIVEDGIHGALVQPGDARQLTEAIARAAANPNLLLDVGRQNAELVSREFTQTDYGDALSALYGQLAADGRADRSSRSAHSNTLVAPKSG